MASRDRQAGQNGIIHPQRQFPAVILPEHGALLGAPPCPTGVPSMRNEGCVSRPRAWGVRKRRLVPGSTSNASLQAVAVGSIWEACPSKRGVHPLWGAWRRAEVNLCLAVVPVHSPEDKREAVLQLKGSNVAECP